MEGKGLAHHSEDGGLSGCVGSGEEVNVRVCSSELDVVRDEVAHRGDQAWMAQLLELENASLVVHEDGPAAGLAERG